VSEAQGKINRAFFGPLNKQIITCSDDGFIRVFDTESGELVRAVEAHADAVNDIQLARDRMTFITASKDQTSCLFDTQTLEKLKTYKADRPLNSACIAPERDHVVIGGGQDASMVTTTAGRSGRFESLLYHKIFETQLGSIKGHFGPINALAFNPNGKRWECAFCPRESTAAVSRPVARTATFASTISTQTTSDWKRRSINHDK